MCLIENKKQVTYSLNNSCGNLRCRMKWSVPHLKSENTFSLRSIREASVRICVTEKALQHKVKFNIKQITGMLGSPSMIHCIDALNW